MGLDFKHVLRESEVITSFPVVRWRLRKKIIFFGRVTQYKSIIYPQLTIEEAHDMLRKYFDEDLSREKFERFDLKQVVSDLYRIYRRNDENQWLKKSDLSKLDRVELLVLVMDTVQHFVKKKLQEVETNQDYRVQRYLESL